MSESSPAVRELRLALVCYGGLSLAIYMHGITKEIQKLVIASRAFEHDGTSNPFDDADSAHAYWDLLRHLRAGDQGDAARQRGVTLRVVVDVISGTSAGGINGVYLAKALAGNHAQDALRDMWFERGDAKQLLRGWRWLHPTPRLFGLVLSALARPVQKKALLRGDDMCVWLHDALETMSGTVALSGETTLIPPGQDLALYVPVTDFHGYPREIPMHDPPLARDRTHRHVMAFRHRRAAGSQFAQPFHHLLGFSARATSSFPGVFEPISFRGYQDAIRHAKPVADGRQVDDDATLGTFFPHHTAAGTAPAHARFIDGGLLDNYPFGEAIAAIETKPAATEVDRRLIYIEPDPGEVGVHPAPEAPSLWRTALAAVATIPAHEPIADDLLRVNRRNDEVLRVRDVVEANFDNVSATVEGLLRDELAAVGDQPSQQTLLVLQRRAEDLFAATAGLGQRAYLRLRVCAALDRFSRDLGDVLQLPPGTYQRDTVARVLRRWAVREHLLDQTEGQDTVAVQRRFLAATDVAFHERRLHFLIAALNWWYRDVGNPDYPSRDELDEAKRQLYLQLNGLAGITSELAADGLVTDAARDAFPARIPRTGGHDDPALDEYVTRYRDRLNTLRDRATSVLTAALAGNEHELHTELLMMMSGWQPGVRHALMTRFLGFPFWDAAIHPLQTISDVGEIDHVHVCRISPLDATLLAPARGKLAGATRHHFGAFFTRPGRERDYLWGRLDAAERLVKLLLEARSAPASLAAAEPVRADPGMSRQQLTQACPPVFGAILADERTGLGNITAHIEELGRAVAELRAGATSDDDAQRTPDETAPDDDTTFIDDTARANDTTRDRYDDAAGTASPTEEWGMADEDIGTVAEVPATQRLDVDEGDGANALQGGDDSAAADRAFQAPGKVKILGGAP